LEYPIKIKPSDGKLLHAIFTGSHNIEVREGYGLRWMHFGGDAIQAMMILQDTSRPIIPYQIYMLWALVLRPNPDFVLNLGVGGGSFERFFAAFLPQVAVTSVESSEEVIGLLREYFPIFPHMPVINQDAEEYLGDCVTTYDLIMCDLFDTSGNLQLTTKACFYGKAMGCLSSKGVFIMNFLPNSEAELVEILAAVRESFQHVLMLLVPHFKNAVLFCLKQEGPDPGLLEQRAYEFLEKTGIDLTEVEKLLVRLPQRVE
jgi:spermidine synthase